MYYQTYDREAAVSYARRWALSRNADYYDYTDIGGDCTNFVSQCVYSGIGIMNFSQTFGWYYLNANNKSPSWTGVRYFYDFMVNNEGIGPFGIESSLEDLEIGDVIQYSRNGQTYVHTLLLTRIVINPDGVRTYYVAAHTYDVLDRELSTYTYQTLRCIHLIAGRR